MAGIDNDLKYQTRSVHSATTSELKSWSDEGWSKTGSKFCLLLCLLQYCAYLYFLVNYWINRLIIVYICHLLHMQSLGSKQPPLRSDWEDCMQYNCHLMGTSYGAIILRPTSSVDHHRRTALCGMLSPPSIVTLSHKTHNKSILMNVRCA